MAELAGVRWQRRMVTQLGCVKACLDHAGLNVSYPWLCGGTGHAFVINVPEGLDPSGPTCWNWQKVFGLAPNVGYRVEGFSIEKEAAGESFPQRQREAWDFVRAALDRGLGCFGWELHPWIPDHYLIYGYDDECYLYSGWMEGRLPWQQLGDNDVQVLQVYSIEPCAPAAEEQTVAEALATAVRLADHPEEWMLAPGYHFGPTAFDAWAEMLEAGTALRDGHAYAASVWHECREAATDFLLEVERRLPGRYGAALTEAARHYAVVRDRLGEQRARYPMGEGWDSETKLHRGAEAALLREAGAAERAALECLRGLV